MMTNGFPIMQADGPNGAKVIINLNHVVSVTYRRRTQCLVKMVNGDEIILAISVTQFWDLLPA